MADIQITLKHYKTSQRAVILREIRNRDEIQTKNFNCYYLRALLIVAQIGNKIYALLTFDTEAGLKGTVQILCY